MATHGFGTTPNDFGKASSGFGNCNYSHRIACGDFGIGSGYSGIIPDGFGKASDGFYSSFIMVDSDGYRKENGITNLSPG
ncbi:MAG: hypothetical protein M0R21_03360 [Lentimicrobiaceae bacterium]|jgi:hypothetical protein|nr:hypothetical protein [Lentimicrobiaceae bacterium]